MRTNIVISPPLMTSALRASGAKSKKEAVERGLRALVQLHGQSRIKSLRGKVNWQGDLEAMRRDRA